MFDGYLEYDTKRALKVQTVWACDCKYRIESGRYPERAPWFEVEVTSDGVCKECRYYARRTPLKELYNPEKARFK